MMEAKELSATEAGTILGVSRSHLYRLRKSYLRDGGRGIASKARNKPSNRAFPPTVKERVLKLIEERYSDFGPTYIAEMLEDAHGLKFSPETIRTWMIEERLWVPNGTTRRRLQQRRKRLPYYGDLIQVDGSTHDWFEGRGRHCTAMVWVDDATGKIQELRFFPKEDRDAYFSTAHSYLSKHGRPVRILTDRHSAVWTEDGNSEFTEAMMALNVLHSVSYSAASKGRVERVHRVLQDRMVKAMRLAGISTIEAANDFAPGFIKKYNMRFQKDPLEPGDSHRSLEGYDADRILSRKHMRRVTKQAGFSFNGAEYLIEATESSRSSIGSNVVVEIQTNGAMAVYGDCGPLQVRRAPQ